MIKLLDKLLGREGEADQEGEEESFYIETEGIEQYLPCTFRVASKDLDELLEDLEGQENPPRSKSIRLYDTVIAQLVYHENKDELQFGEGKDLKGFDNYLDQYRIDLDGFKSEKELKEIFQKKVVPILKRCPGISIDKEKLGTNYLNELIEKADEMMRRQNSHLIDLKDEYER